MKEITIPTNKSIININTNNTEVAITGEDINYTKLSFSDDIKYNSYLNTAENMNTLDLSQELQQANFDYQFIKSMLLKEKKAILVDELAERVTIKEYRKDSQIKITLPKDSRKTTINLIGKSANLTINNLLYQNISVQTKSGEIIMHDIDGEKAKVLSNQGDIRMQIDESALNYNLKLNSKLGNIYKESLEKKEPEILKDIHSTIEAESISGDINVLFLGRTKH